MVARLYSAYGLNVLSELEVGLPLAEDRPVDIELSVGDVSELTTTVPEGRYLAGSSPGADFRTVLVADDQGYILRVKELADVRISPDVRSVLCHPAPGAGPEHMRELSATILSFVLPLRHTVALHSSCVLGVDGLAIDGAIALIGGSASGKSTLAGHLSAAGAGFITDDLLPVRLEGHEVVVTGGCLELRLRPTATDLLGAFGDKARRATIDERTAVRLGVLRSYPVPLRLVLMPEVDLDARQVKVGRLPAGEAVVKLLAMGRSGGWAPPEAQALYFSTVAAIANGMPVLTVSWSPLQLDLNSLVATVRGHLP